MAFEESVVVVVEGLERIGGHLVERERERERGGGGGGGEFMRALGREKGGRRE